VRTRAAPAALGRRRAASHPRQLGTEAVVAAAGEQGRVLADRYELHHQVGRGGAGAVWRGHDRALDRPVAVKLLHTDLSDDRDAGARFRTEATAAAKLTHPNAVLIYDLGRHGHETYLVMELVEGVNLGDVLHDGPLPAGAAAALGAQVASALGTAHGAGIVHRDVKPGNVLVTTDGVAKLADFGIARALGAVTTRLTRTGTVLGTARYLAPEQLRDDPIDARADVYALGLVLHETLTGRPPFGEGNAVEVAARRLTTSLPAVSDLVAGIPPGLDELIRWATRVDPSERPADGGELATALRHFASRDADAVIAARVARVPERNTSPVTSEPIAPVGPPPAPRADTPTDGTAAIGSHRAEEVPAPTQTGPLRPSGRRRWLLGVAAAVAVLIVAIGVNAGRDGDRDEGAGGATPTVSQSDEGDALAIAAAGSLDPDGGNQVEHPGDVEEAFDDDPESYWPTETYHSANFGGYDKAGVGIWLELEEPAQLDRVVVELSAAGGTLELWGSEGGPPAADQLPEDWGTRLGGGEVPDRRTQFADLADGEVSTILLWFTDLPEEDGRWRAEVHSVRLIGR
jgi:hypothetical protein